MPEPSVLRSVSLKTLERLDAKLEPTLATLKNTFTAIELNPDLAGLRDVASVMVKPRQDFADMKFPTELGGGAQSVAELVQGLPLQEVALLKPPFKAGIEDIAESRTAGLAMATGLMGLIDAGITPGDRELTQLVNLGLGADVVSRTARAKTPFAPTHCRPQRPARAGWGADFWGAEERRFAGRERSELRPLTSRRLFDRSEAQGVRREPRPGNAG